MQIEIIPTLSDNYSYLVHNGRHGAVVDPAEAAPIEAILQKLDVALTQILVTHNHMDHIAGVGPLARDRDVAIFAPENKGLPPDTRCVGDDEIVAVGNTEFHVMATPGHVQQHVVYYEPEQRWLFSGDTLFACGCGRLLGSTANALWQSLQHLRALPGNTQVYCGHEYTLNNIAFALSVDADNVALRERAARVREQRDKGIPSIPFRLEEDIATNPFLRADTTEIQTLLAMTGEPPERVFAELRRRKDAW